MLQDLHSHTYYSFCGADQPEAVVEAAIAGGLSLIGITDHNYGVCCQRLDVFFYQNQDLGEDHYRCLKRYYDHIKLLQDKYKNKIKILCGIELSTLYAENSYTLPASADISFFDYCLVENLDAKNSIIKGDIFSYAKRCGCPTGIAHTDMFAFIRSIGEEPYRYFRKMAENGIFWELNVNFDSMHEFKTHAYVTEFFKNKEQQEIVRKSGVRLSVGFDSHIAREYKADRVKAANKLVKDAGIHLIFEGK